MAEDYDDDNYLSDNGFEELPAKTLHQLERDAVTSSQRTHAAAARRDTFAQSHMPSRQMKQEPLYQPARQQQHQTTRPDVNPAPGPPSSDYGFDDEDVIDLDEPSMVIQPASGPPLRKVSDHDEYDEYQAAGGTQNLYAQQQIEHEERGDYDMRDLQSRIAELERERLVLQKSVQDAKAEAVSKSGEIAIVRSKHEKAVKEYETKMTVMHKLHAEESAKQKAEIEASRKEQETVRTNNRFLEHDLAQEVERSKRRKGTAMSATNGANGTHSTGQHQAGTVATPRKAFHIPYRDAFDGFDDHEIMATSPSKSREKSRSDTPKAGAKRKRQAEASPSIPLHLTQPRVQTQSESVNTQVLDGPSLFNGLHFETLSLNLQTTQRILNHSPYAGHERTMEALTRVTYPDNPAFPPSEQSISAMLIQTVSSFTSTKEEHLAVEICRTLTNHLSRCLAQKFYAPVYLLMDLFDFIMSTQPAAIQVLLIDQFVPLAIQAIDLIARPLAIKYVSDSAAMTALDTVAQAEIADQIDVDQILGILNSLAMSASLDSVSAKTFWQHMGFEFVLVMLNRAQPLPQSTLMLQMISSSVLSDSFGAINADIHMRSRIERDAIDRLTSCFFERPDAPADEEPYNDAEIAGLRVEILRTLGAICSTDHGSTTLAQHRTAIGRLIRFLDLQVDSLYRVPAMTVVQKSATSADVEVATVHELIVTSINLTTRLLYQLLRNYPDLINMREKLAVIRGGHHKFLIAFTRLAFSERLVFEAGIEEEVLDAAHEILDVVLTPEEGEAVVKAVETPRGTTGTRASVPIASAPG